MKKYQEALDAFEEAVKKNPEAYASLYQIGRTAIFWGKNIDQGILALKQYIEADPGTPNPGLDAAHWRLGMLYEMKGNNQTALHEYTLALEMRPDEEKYKKAIERLN